MSLPRSVAEFVREHITLEVEGIDRVDLNAYVPRLQYTGPRRCRLIARLRLWTMRGAPFFHGRGT